MTATSRGSIAAPAGPAAMVIARSAIVHSAIVRRHRANISGRAATIAIALKVTVPKAIARKASRLTAPARVPTGLTRRARKATGRSAVRRAAMAAVASAVAVGAVGEAPKESLPRGRFPGICEERARTGRALLQWTRR